MAKPQTPKSIINMGYAQIGLGILFIILNLFERIYFLFEVYLNLLFIVMGFVIIILGIKHVSKGKSYIKQGFDPNVPIPRNGLMVPRTVLRCPACERDLSPGMEFCPFCGNNLK